MQMAFRRDAGAPQLKLAWARMCTNSHPPRLKTGRHVGDEEEEEEKSEEDEDEKDEEEKEDEDEETRRKVWKRRETRAGANW